MRRAHCVLSILVALTVALTAVSAAGAEELLVEATVGTEDTSVAASLNAMLRETTIVGDDVVDTTVLDALTAANVLVEADLALAETDVLDETDILDGTAVLADADVSTDAVLPDTTLDDVGGLDMGNVLNSNVQASVALDGVGLLADVTVIGEDVAVTNLVDPFDLDLGGCVIGCPDGDPTIAGLGSISIRGGDLSDRASLDGASGNGGRPGGNPPIARRGDGLSRKGSDRPPGDAGDSARNDVSRTISQWLSGPRLAEQEANSLVDTTTFPAAGVGELGTALPLAPVLFMAIATLLAALAVWVERAERRLAGVPTKRHLSEAVTALVRGDVPLTFLRRPPGTTPPSLTWSCQRTPTGEE